MSIILVREFVVAAVVSAGLFFGVSGARAQSWVVTSPDGETKVTVQREPAGGKLSYRVERGSGSAATIMLKDSPLGLRLQGLDLSEGLQLESSSGSKIDERYTMVHGKRAQCENHANQLTFVFSGKQGRKLELDMRAYNDGVAFRYRVPGSGEKVVLESETSGFALPEGAKMWAAPSDKPTTYAPAYETYYESGVPSGTVAPLGLGWSFPMLFRTADGNRWGLITEANVGSNFCGSRLSSAATNGVYSVCLPTEAEGNGSGSVNPGSALPWEMPWRVLILGDSPGAVVESTLVTDVSAPAEVTDTSWIKPGRVAWSWWSDQPSPKSATAQKKFVDLAAQMGWEYVLVDANWTIMEDGNIHEVLRYANQKNIGVLLWYNSGGPHNVVTEKPRDTLTYEPVRQFELKMLRDWGVKGIKVDFFQSDKQATIDLYQSILKDAAANRIMLNFHGCTLPRGWDRRHPHLMSMEAVRGEECYIFDPKYPEAAPVQNAILPFTRNAVGPMDYTPVGFSDNRYPHLTTVAHELALAVLFESGWLHFTDKAEAYLSLPSEPKQFLKEVPVAWDDTRFVAGYPGEFAVLARRKGKTWYIAGINGTKQPKQLSVKPGAWLAAPRYAVTVIGDGQTARTFQSQSRNLSKGEQFEVNMLPAGGFVAVLKP
jgi:hypothetical protein